MRTRILGAPFQPQRDVAQLEEHPAWNRKVVRSNRTIPTHEVTKRSVSERSTAGARLLGVQEDASSNLAVPTTKQIESRDECAASTQHESAAHEIEAPEERYNDKNRNRRGP